MHHHVSIFFGYLTHTTGCIMHGQTAKYLTVVIIIYKITNKE